MIVKGVTRVQGPQPGPSGALPFGTATSSLPAAMRSAILDATASGPTMRRAISSSRRSIRAASATRRSRSAWATPVNLRPKVMFLRTSICG